MVKESIFLIRQMGSSQREAGFLWGGPWNSEVTVLRIIPDLSPSCICSVTQGTMDWREHSDFSQILKTLDFSLSLDTDTQRPKVPSGLPLNGGIWSPCINGSWPRSSSWRFYWTRLAHRGSIEHMDLRWSLPQAPNVQLEWTCWLVCRTHKLVSWPEG